MTGLERVLAAAQFQPVDRVPFAPLMGAHALALARVSHKQASRHARSQAHALLRAVELYRPDAVFTVMDLSAEPEALGAGVEMAQGQAPVIVRHLTRDQLETDEVERRILTGRVPVFVETVALLRQEFGDSLLVGALMCGPLTAASNAVGIESLSRMLRRERELLTHVLGRLANACLSLQRHYAAAGAHAVVLLEPVATTAILGPADLEALLLPHLQRVTRAARDEGLLSVLHVCGDCRASVPLLAEAGAQVLSLDSEVDLPEAGETVGGKAALMGNLDVKHLLPSASAGEVSRAARDLISRMGDGFVLSTGCELPASTPTANVAALVAAVTD